MNIYTTQPTPLPMRPDIVTMAVIILTVLIVVVFFLYHHFSKYNNYWKDRNVAGPKPTFFFGNVKEYVLRRKVVGDIFNEIYHKYSQEKIVGVFRMRTPDVLVRDPEIIKTILIKDFDSFVDRGSEFSKKGLGLNLFHTDGDTWRVLRNRFTPLFTSGKLKNMMYLMTERGDKFVEYVDKITKINPEHEIHGLVQKFTQAIIAACAFGLDIDTFEEQHKTLKRLDKAIFSVNYSFELEMMYPGLLKIIGGSLFPKEVKDFFFNLTKNVIAQRNGKPSNKNDFMDLILALRNDKQISGPKRENDDNVKTLDITDDVIAAQSFIFYAAGYETSASTMGFMLYHLALNPDIQEKVAAEIKEVLEKHDGKLTLQAVLDMNYMSKVFDETLRMHPIVSVLKRCAQTEFEVPGTDLTVKKGQLFHIPVSAIHWDKKYYPKPEVFDPERFSAENVAGRHSCVYLPFGLGPRHCIGECLTIVLTFYNTIQ